MGTLWAAAAMATDSPRSFAYVLQADQLAKTREAVVERLAACDRDWIILDAAFETGGSPKGRWTAEEIARIRAGRAGRRVLAYLSIGEAEDYRAYWRREWDRLRDGKPDPGAPPWLLAENPEWKGNYRVRYWHPDWQEMILREADAIVAAGFDGVWLDIVDGYEFFEFDPARQDWIDHRPNPETGRPYRRDMVEWVGRLAARTRRERPDFLIVPQNGEALLDDSHFLRTISAIGVEDLFTDGRRAQPADEMEHRLAPLRRAREEGRPVLAIEYAARPDLRRRSAELAERLDFALLFADRKLRTLGENGRNTKKSTP